MGVVKKLPVEKLNGWLKMARAMEKENREGAVKKYKRITIVYPVSETAYDRLMILYRQLKMPDEELALINKAMTAFEKSFASLGRKLSPKIAAISRSIIKSTGLTDKKGKFYYQPQPIARWQKRKDLLLKKMK
jgi:hypothetical protein